MILSEMYLKKVFKFAYYLYYCFLACVDFFLRFKSREQNQNILIIKIDRFGDFVLWNEYFHNILEHYKDKNIFFICNIQLENYLKRHYKKITFITIDKYSFLINLKYRIKKIFFLRNFYFEKVINFHRERDIYFSDCIVKNANAFQKIGNKIKKKSLLNYISNNYYDLLLETKDNTHEMFYLDQFTKKVLGNKSYNSKKKIFFKKNKNYKKYENCILISFGGTDKKKLVSLEYMLNSINLKNNKTKIVLVGNITEMNSLSSNYVFYQKNFINLSGKTSFDEFIYLHFLAKTILSNDSASGHLAHYFKKNSYTFLGGGHFKRFFPYPNESNKKHKYIYKKMKCFNCNWNCIYDNLSLKKYPCIDAIYKKKI